MAGVAGAVANEIGIDRRWIRIAFVLLALCGGAGVALYGLGIFLIPEEGHDKSFAQQWLDTDDRLRTAGALIVLLLAFGFLFGWGSGWRHGLFPGGWVLIVVGLLLLFGPRLDRDRAHYSSPPDGPRWGPTPPDDRPEPTSSVAGPADLALADRPGMRTDAPPTEGAAPADADLQRARKQRSARRWRLALATFASLVIGAVVALVVAISTGALPLGWGWGDRSYRPAAVSELKSNYRLFAGDQQIDLTNLTLRNGQQARLHVDQRFGKVEVIVPADARVELDTHVRAGTNRAFGRNSDGWNNDQPLASDTPPGWHDGPTIVLDLHVTAGEIDVIRGTAGGN